jgi:hypothetical protein
MDLFENLETQSRILKYSFERFRTHLTNSLSELSSKNSYNQFWGEIFPDKFQKIHDSLYRVDFEAPFRISTHFRISKLILEFQNSFDQSDA